MTRQLGFATLALMLLQTAALAADDTAESKALAGYTHTGKYELCLTAHLIRSSQILNRNQILFEMVGGEWYLAEANCSSMGPDLGLSYDATPDHLCNTTVITLIESGNPPRNRGSCGITRFEKLEKK